MRRVVFTSERSNMATAGSFYLRAVQVYMALQRHGIKAFMESPEKLATQSGNIIFFIKPIENSMEKIETLCENNTVILDPLDFIPIFKDLPPGLVHGCLFNNNKARNKFIHLFKNKEMCPVIYHHIDLRFRSATNPPDELKFLYLGTNSERKVYAYNEFDDIDYKSINGNPSDFNQYTDLIGKYNCHYIVNGLKDAKRRSYEPFTKLAMASINHSPVITYKKDHIEILGEYYPYYITSKDTGSVKNMINYIKKTYKTKVWNDAVSIMKDAKEKFLLGNTIHTYIDIIKKH
jgi:hypothetical protein